VVEAALVLLERMGLSPADLVAAPANLGRAYRKARRLLHLVEMITVLQFRHERGANAL
jgi:hypothetical protein